jgi:predicted RNA binding protein YcfA (HicA-like mRNA interferase family)
MSGLPAIKFRTLIRFITDLGYEQLRVHGRHYRFFLKKHAGGDGNLTIARERGGIPEGTLLNMLRDISVHTGVPVADLKIVLDTY